MTADPLLLTPKEPDAMGVWNEDGDTIWLPRSLYPRRWDAVKWAMEQWTCSFLEVRCVVRWMRYEPLVAENLDRSVAWSEDRWWECAEDVPGSFKVWRLEAV